MPIKTIILIMILVTSLFPIAAPDVARAGLVLSVQPDTTYIEVSSEFNLSFCLEGETVSLMGYHVIFSYDPDYLEVVSVDEGSLPADSGEETFFHCNTALTDTTVEVNGAVLGAEVETPGCVFKVTFRALEAGRTFVVIRYSDIRDGTNNGISHNTRDGVVIITPEISTEQESWGRIKSIYR